MGVKTVRTLAAVVVMVMLAGCGGTDGSSGGNSSLEEEATTTADALATPTPPTANVRYDSVYDLRERIEAAGISCDDWWVIPDPKDAVERAVCTDALGFAIHTDASQAAASIAAVSGLVVDEIGETSAHLIGPNWTANCSDEAGTCEQLRGELGGEMDVREP